MIQGREVDGEKVRWLRGWIAERQHWSRRKLAGELCVLWDWRDASGRPKDLAARSLLLKIERRGWIVLPPLREAYRKPRAGIRLPASLPQEESLEAGFKATLCTNVTELLCARRRLRLEIHGPGTVEYTRTTQNI